MSIFCVVYSFARPGSVAGDRADRWIQNEGKITNRRLRDTPPESVMSASSTLRQWSQTLNVRTD